MTRWHSWGYIEVKNVYPFVNLLAPGDDTCVVMPDFFRGFPILNPYGSFVA